MLLVLIVEGIEALCFPLVNFIGDLVVVFAPILLQAGELLSDHRLGLAILFDELFANVCIAQTRSHGEGVDIHFEEELFLTTF